MTYKGWTATLNLPAKDTIYLYLPQRGVPFRCYNPNVAAFWLYGYDGHRACCWPREIHNCKDYFEICNST